MSTDRNPQLEALFNSDQDLPVDDQFTVSVERAIDRRRKKILLGRILIITAIVALELALNLPVQSTLGILAEWLETSLLPMGDGWIATLLAPLNSVAGVVGMCLVALHYLYRRFVH